MTTEPSYAANPDPKIQADQVLAKVSTMLGAALLKIRVTAGDPNTIVHSGYPCTVITTDKGESGG